MRYALFAAALACSAAVATAVLAGIAAPVSQDRQDWRRQQLVFLKAAYDRMETDLQSRPSASSIPSLRREQASLLQRMADIAKPLPADQLPDGVRSLLPAATASKPVAALAAPVEAAVAASAQGGGPTPTSRLRPGLAMARPADTRLDGIEIDAELRAPLHLSHHKKVASKPPADKAAEGKPAESGKPAERKAAEAKPAEAKPPKVATADPH